MDLGSLPVDVIVANGSEAAQAAQRATSGLPIVAASSDPVGTGLVASLAHPGGNVTGISYLAPPLAGKRLELLRAVAPGMTCTAVLWNPADPPRVIEFGETQQAAGILGLALHSVEVHGPHPDLAGAFAAIAAAPVEGLLVLGDPLLALYSEEVAARAAQTRLPAMYSTKTQVLAGGLMSYGTDFYGMGRRTAYYVDRILQGAKPADLPVEQPTTFDFVINLKTAQALGLTIPEHVLLQATEVFQ
jgi:putative ABC transport system substrate-binding protein